MNMFINKKDGSVTKIIALIAFILLVIAGLIVFITVLNYKAPPKEVTYNLTELSENTGIGDINTDLVSTDLFEEVEAKAGNTIPIAAYTVTTPVIVGQPVVFTDQSYDQDLGGSIVNWHWEGRKDFYTKPGVYTVTLKVQDDQGDWSEPISHVVTVLEPEKVEYTIPPIACFKATNPVYTGETVIYEDCSYSPSGLPIDDRMWSGKQSYFTSAGIYKVTLKVKDSSGKWSDPLYMNIQVKERPVVETQNRPVALFDVTTPVYVGQKIVYTDKSYDPDGDTIVKKEWSANKQDSYDKVGTYNVSLRVQDKHGEWSEVYTQKVEVITSPNTPPVANFKPTEQVYVGEKVDWLNTSYDTDGTIAREQWTGDKRYLYNEPGIYSITLTVWDNEGASGSITRNIKVVDPTNKAPVAKFRTNSPVSLNERVYFYDDSYDTDGEIVKFEWSGDKRDNYDKPGTYEVTLTVWDNNGGFNSYTSYIEVNKKKNEKPVAQIAGPEYIYVNQTVTFEDKSYDTDGYIASTSWGKPTISKTWSKPGTYNVDLKVTDNYGDETFTSIVVYVREEGYPLGPSDY